MSAAVDLDREDQFKRFDTTKRTTYCDYIAWCALIGIPADPLDWAEEHEVVFAEDIPASLSETVD
jgi:hypothetical protein